MLFRSLRLWNEGKRLESIPSWIGAGGGALSMIPTPMTRAIGTGLSLAPLAYEAYKSTQ